MEYRERFKSYTEPCPVGDGTSPEFSYDDSGELVCTGQVDVQAIIDSHVHECDIGYILSRAVGGDKSALQARIGQYIDTTQLPDNLCDELLAVDQAKQIYGNMSDEQKKLFDDGDYDALKEDLVSKGYQSAKSADDERAKLLARLQELNNKEDQHE